MTKILELNIAPVLIVLNSIKITSAMNKNKIQQRKNIFSYTHMSQIQILKKIITLPDIKAFI